jgi:hypothetical protein
MRGVRAICQLGLLVVRVVFLGSGATPQLGGVEAGASIKTARATARTTPLGQRGWQPYDLRPRLGGWLAGAESAD